MLGKMLGETLGKMLRKILKKKDIPPNNPDRDYWESR